MSGPVTVLVDVDCHPLTSQVIDLVTGLPGWSVVDHPIDSESSSEPSSPDIEVTVRQTSDLPHVTITYHDPTAQPPESVVERENPCGTPNDVVVLLCDVVEEVLGRRATEVLIHGGAVIVEGSVGVLLLGESKAGKSTLVTTFVDAGAALCTDEVIAVAADGTAFGYTRPLHLRPEAPRSTRVEQWATINGGRFDVTVPPHVHAGTFQPVWCVLIDRRADISGVMIDPVSTATMARALIDGSFNAYRRDWDGVAELAALAPRLRGIRLGYSAATHAVDAMLTLVSTHVCPGSADSLGMVTGPCAIEGRRGFAWCYEDSVLIVDGDRVRVVAVAGGPGANPELRSARLPKTAGASPSGVAGMLDVPEAWLAIVDAAFGGDNW